MSTSDDTVPPLRNDLRIIPQHYRGELCYVVKDPVTLDYYRLGEIEYAILQCFQKGLGVEEAREEVYEKTGAEVTNSEVYKFVRQLRHSNLLKSKGMSDVPRLVETRRKQKKQGWKQFVSNYLFITIPLWDPDETLEKLLPYFRFFLRPFFLICCLALGLGALWVVVTNFSVLVADAFSVLSGWNIAILSGVVFGMKIFHEMGHALTCKHFGGEVHAIGPAFLVFQPCMYTDTSDAWLLPNKWDRLKVTGAGIASEFLLAAIAALVWVSSEPGFLKQLSYTTMVASSVSSILFNANPLLRFDGYYMMSDLLEIPNMRSKTNNYLGYLFERYMLGIKNANRPDMNPDDRFVYVTYGIARFVYRIFIVVMIGFFLYSLFEPLGIATWLSSFYGMIVAPTWKRGKKVAREYKRGGLRVKYMLFLALATAMVAGICFIPIKYTISAPCVLSPQAMTVVRTKEAGRIARIPVKHGERVKKGQVLVRMENPELRRKLQRTREKLREVRAEIRMTLNTNMAKYLLKQSKKRKLKASLKELKSRVDNLILRAPHEGTIVNVHQQEMKMSSPQHRFVRFSTSAAEKTPQSLRNMTAKTGLGILAVARTSSPVLKTFVPEHKVSKISTGDSVRAMLRDRVSTIVETRVQSISSVDVKTIENIGITLADVGYIPIENTKEGEKKPLVTLYAVHCPLQESESEFIGLTGKTNITYDSGPLGAYYFNKLVQALKLRLQKV